MIGTVIELGANGVPLRDGVAVHGAIAVRAPKPAAPALPTPPALRPRSRQRAQVASGASLIRQLKARRREIVRALKEKSKLEKELVTIDRLLSAASATAPVRARAAGELRN